VGALLFLIKLGLPKSKFKELCSLLQYFAMLTIVILTEEDNKSFKFLERDRR
jgi:hypothetical protein